MKTQATINQVITDIASKLSVTFDDPTLCRQYAWWMVEAITNKTQAQLIAQNIISFSQKEQIKLASWIDKITTQHIPIQYLIGFVPFNDVEILVQPPTLIPRPETEEWTLQLIKQLQTLDHKNFVIIDLCTGSGCIALALGHAFPQAQIYATDISPDAITLAQKNAQHNNIKNVTFILSDLFAKLPSIKADIIVANPPYIAEYEWQTLDTSVTKWEDKQALVANHEGLAIIQKIIEQAPQWLRSNDQMAQHNIPQVVIEIGYQQAISVVALMKQAHYTAIEVHKDLEEKDRVVCGRVKYVASAKAG
ncbi:MAG TPA: peptide chain release factor N(5)-glutamine methyltransferase [Candidatus Dependentiae bacterium]|nr:peptide chain release factor N(5)-glutamine methyltransferase [Candidatus Dependentiae bacterium]HRQ62869.1 peptide chain release factor N(5)-glutamine methyltransferase [Candidatus Dependentiae bacterium]